MPPAHHPGHASSNPEGLFPHICGLRLKSSVPFPEGWRLAAADAGAAGRRMQARPGGDQDEDRGTEAVGLEAVRLAIEDMETEFPGNTTA